MHLREGTAVEFSGKGLITLARPPKNSPNRQGANATVCRAGPGRQNGARREHDYRTGDDCAGGTMPPTPEEIAELRESFNYNDPNADGKIDFDEFRRMLD